MVRLISKIKNRSGFTLVELIVVLAVLGVIMAIAVPRFMGVQNTAKVDSDKVTLANIAKLAELEYIKESLSDAETFDAIKSAEIINDNFAEKNLFQSTDLKNEEDNLYITFSTEGKVNGIYIGSSTGIKVWPAN